MELIYKAKLKGGGQIYIFDKRIDIKYRKHSATISITQVMFTNFLPWDCDPTIFIETASGIIIKMEVKPEEKTKIKNAIQIAQAKIFSNKS